MMITSNQMRSLGWAVLLAFCLGMFVVLSLSVHAVKSEVLLAERKIIALERETLLLETEFETRASQRQLANWNSVEFGFEAPRADQYLEGERQLAELGQPMGPNAPSPIRVAKADLAEGSAIEAPEREVESPITGETITLAAASPEDDSTGMFSDAFGDFLIEASPIRSANAQTGADAASNIANASATLASDAARGRE